MCFFKKKKAAKTQADRDLILVSSKAIEPLIVLAGIDIDMVEVLKELQEKIKYLTPSHKSEVINYDRLIRNRIDDLRSALIKFGDTDNSDVKKIITEIKTIIADRATKL